MTDLERAEAHYTAMAAEAEKDKLLVEARDHLEATNYGCRTCTDLVRRIDAALKPAPTVRIQDRWAL